MPSTAPITTPVNALAARPTIAPLRPAHLPAVEALLDRAFGPGRHGRTAYLVRGTAPAIEGLGFVALNGDDQPVGSIQCWPVALSGDDGIAHPLVMIGPVAVDPDRQQGGIGRQLTEAALAAANRLGLDGAMMLIGDPEYYARFFGFSAARTAGWRLPGPVERHRLLARGECVPDAAGMLGPGEAMPG
jgi:predicted N-acetyltransferase YhbS